MKKQREISDLPGMETGFQNRGIMRFINKPVSIKTKTGGNLQKQEKTGDLSIDKTASLHHHGYNQLNIQINSRYHFQHL
jgi:hypothetical protein